MFKWPDRAAVDAAVRALAARLRQVHPGLRRFGYFGSYARGDWGVGSDVDLVAIVGASARPFPQRALDFDVTGPPVPAELIVYTEDEWQRLPQTSPRFARELTEHAVWVS